MKVLPLPCKWLGWPRKIAVPSPVGDVKNSVPSKYFRAKYIDTQIKCFFLNPRFKYIFILRLTIIVTYDNELNYEEYTIGSNRPFPSCSKPLFQSEAKCKDIY